MSYILDSVETRIVAILESARGNAVPFSADAQARYFPSGRLRRSLQQMPLEDPDYPAAAFDRSYELSWAAIGHVPSTNNPHQSVGWRGVRLDLHVGFVYGKAIPAFIRTTGSEVAATAVVHVRKRALSEMERVLNALCFSDIYLDQGAEASTPVIYAINATGDTVLDDIGGGRLLARAPLLVEVERVMSTAFDP